MKMLQSIPDVSNRLKCRLKISDPWPFGLEPTSVLKNVVGSIKRVNCGPATNENRKNLVPREGIFQSFQPSCCLYDPFEFEKSRPDCKPKRLDA